MIYKPKVIHYLHNDKYTLHLVMLILLNNRFYILRMQ